MHFCSRMRDFHVKYCGKISKKYTANIKIFYYLCIMISIQKNIRQILSDRGILQKQVANKLGMSDQAFSNWFTRKSDLTFDQIQRICEAAGISLVDVVTYPVKYIPESEAQPNCEECQKKQKMIDNLTELLDIYKAKSKKK